MNVGVIVPLIIYLLAMFAVGIYASRHVKKAPQFLQEYFLGGRELGGLLLAMTIVTTFSSASSFIGGPGTAYTVGLGWVLLSMTQLVTGYFTLSVLGKKFAIVARKIEAVTIIDFLKARYESKWVVILSAISIVLFLFAAMAAQWIGGGRLIESITNLPYQVSLFIFVLAVLVYVTIGGFRAVAITDLIQGIIMFFGTIIIFVAVVYAGGGIESIVDTLKQENPNLITPFGADGTLSKAFVSSFWILVGIGVVGVPQVVVKAMTYKDSKAMHQAIIIGTVMIGFIMLGMHLIGVFARAIMPGIEVGDTVMPLITLKVLPDWLAGIVLAAPMAAIMSTVSSLLLMISSTIIKDVYISYIKPDISDRQIKHITMIITAILGLAVFFFVLQPPNLLIWLNLYSFGGLEAAFIWPIVLGLYWKRGNKYGAIASMLVGVLSFILLSLYYPRPLGMHPVVPAILFSFVAYVTISLLTSHKMKEQQERIIEKFWYVS
ncbi:sodium/pantothenate symporter [Massilibacterium senegalense]|uniref:sodium/pantothenate symporter n=1 Tax=Massilibacterium senegalense TaxID=1632858 RepID=UPI0007840573|nr:sodium/pantothenate symporter [Massilibacterium senegalense]